MLVASQSCHQYKPSPTSITNINETHKTNQDISSCDFKRKILKNIFSSSGFLGINFEIYPGAEFMMIRSFRRFVQIKVKMQISTGDEVSIWRKWWTYIAYYALIWRLSTGIITGYVGDKDKRTSTATPIVCNYCVVRCADWDSTVRIRPSIIICVFFGSLCRKRPKCVGCKIISFDLW